MTPSIPDRLAILNVSGSQEDRLFKHLVKEKFSFTVIKSTGGMIQEPEICLLIGFHSERLPVLLEVVRKNCRPFRRYISARGFMQGELAGPPMLEAQMGGARFYMMNIERFEQL